MVIEGSTLCYKNGPQLPPLNFTRTCIEYGRYVIFYNERLDGVIYPEGYEVISVFTELCEVVVIGKQNLKFYFLFFIFSLLPVIFFFNYTPFDVFNALHLII